MELYVLDGDFQPVGVVDVFSSLIWNRKYYEDGDFELHTTVDFLQMLLQGAYVCRTDGRETAMIETVQAVTGDTGQREVTAKGRFLERLLSSRAIDAPRALEGTGEEIIRGLVDSFGISPTVAARRIPKLVLGAVSGVGSAISYQATEGDLLDAIREIAVSQELGISLTYDYEKDQLLFTVFQGKDRTQEQTANPWAVFSPDYENMLSTDYSYSVEDYKNYAYVAGEGETVEVDLSQGEYRREIYIDAGDIRRTTDNGGSISLENYREMLRQRGIERLMEYQKNLTLEGAIHPNANSIYKDDFDLGDKCSYVDHNMGIAAVERITAITEVYENGGMTIQAAFGTQQRGIMQKLRREVK